MSNPDISEYQDILLWHVMQHFDPAHADDALERALKNPSNDSDIGLEARIIGQLAVSDLSAAKSMLPRTRNWNTRLAALTHIGVVLVESGKYSDALRNAFELPSKRRADYYSDLMEQWVKMDFDSAAESIGLIEDPIEKSSATLQVILHGRTHGALSNRELANLRDHLTSADEESL